MRTADRVKETTATTGVGPFALGGAAPGFRAFAAKLSVADTIPYCCVSADATEWEVGIGTYSAINQLTRTTIIDSSNSGAAVSFSAGIKSIFATFSALQIAKLASADDPAVTTIADLATASALIEQGGVTQRISLNNLAAAMGASASDLPAAAALSGTDIVTLTQGGDDVRTTLSDLLDWIVVNGGGGALAVPGQVTGLTVGTPAETSMPLTWTATATGGAPSDYLVEYKATSSGIWLTFSDGTSTTVSVTVTGLTANTSYDFRTTATNATGPGVASAVVTASTAAASGPSYTLTGPPAAGGSFPSAPASIASGYQAASFAIRVKDAGGISPPAMNFAWSKSNTVAPATYNAAAPSIANANDRKNGAKVGGWGTDTGHVYYGLWTADGTVYAWGTPGTYYLWVLTSDGFSGVYDNGTGTPIGWVLTP